MRASYSETCRGYKNENYDIALADVRYIQELAYAAFEDNTWCVSHRKRTRDVCVLINILCRKIAYRSGVDDVGETERDRVRDREREGGGRRSLVRMPLHSFALIET